MIRKVILLILIATVAYFLYSPMVIKLRDVDDLSEFTLKPNQVFKLTEVLNLKDINNVTIYIVLNNEERKYFSLKVPKWKVLKTENSTLIKDLFNCEFKYTNSDVATVQSWIYVYSGSKLVFESEISLEENHFGLQNSYTGWVSSIDENNLLRVTKQFDRYNLPFLIID